MEITTKSSELKEVKFEDYGLKKDLLRGIYGYGWECPSSIQKDAIPSIMTGRDVVMQAPSGRGKTGAFSTSVLQKIDENNREIQGIILLPTRELADQVYKVIQSLGEYLKLNFIKCVGGVKVMDNLSYPDRGTILIGTPGKISAVLNKTLIKSQTFNIKILVIDEFDKMLEEDFIPTIQEIFRFVNDNTQVVLSSATVNGKVMEVTQKFMRDPLTITIEQTELSLAEIKQYYINCEKDEWKFDTILDLYKTIVVAQSIIFVNSKKKCQTLEEMFIEKDFTVKSIHGEIEQAERESIMEEFRSGKIRILLSTDLMGRGIDVPSVTLVINYDLPNDCAQYIHRIGRTGRFGKRGASINLIGSRGEMRVMKTIEDHYKIIIDELPNNYASIL